MQQNNKDASMQDGINPYWVAGVDEAGRGPLAGPVIAAAVILNPLKPIAGLADSKKMTHKQREVAFAAIRANALAWTVARATVAEIDELNILHASMLAMRRAVLKLPVVPQLVLVDGNRCPDLPYETRAIIKGDAKEQAISAASIVAKVLRDRLMCFLDKRYPQYGLAKHKGYPTAAHMDAIRQHGVNRIYRRSFSPVAELL